MNILKTIMKILIKIFKKIRSENWIPFLLFLIILINYIPLFVGNFKYGDYAVNTKEMAICFGIEIIILFIYTLGRVKVLKLNTLLNLLLLIVTTSVMVTVQKENYLSGNYETYDLINIACIFLNIFWLFIIFTNLKVEERSIKWFYIGMVLLGLVACAVNVYLYKEEIITMFTESRQISVKSFFAHRNQFAIFLFAAIISNIMLILKANKKIVKALLFVPLIIFGFSLITTSSRTGIATTAIFIILFFITTSSIKFVHKFFIIYLLTVLIISGYVISINKYPEIATKVESFVENVLVREGTIKTFTGRDKFWEIAVGVLNESKTNMFFGIGRFLAINLIEQFGVTQFHNAYVEALMAGGIMELAFFIYIHLFVLIKVFISKIDLKYKLLYLSMLISLGVYGMFESMCRFSIGCADTICIVFFITMPLVHSNVYVRDNRMKVLEEVKSTEEQNQITETLEIKEHKEKENENIKEDQEKEKPKEENQNKAKPKRRKNKDRRKK